MDDCSVIPEIKYSDFSQQLHNRVGSQHIPIVGTFELTMRCNLHCQHCYIPPDWRSKQQEGELNLQEIKSILDQVTDAGCFWLLLTGGEPLSRPDFLDIYSYAKHKGLILTLFTNGTLITPRVADYLEEWRPFNIEITLYGATEETYENVTGIPGSYKHCRRGIELLLEHNLPLVLKTMVMKPNYHELEQMKAIADSLGVQFRFDPVLHAAIDKSTRPISLRLTPEEVVKLEKADPVRASKWPKSLREKMTYREKDRSLYLCGAGKTSFHIDGKGRLSACISNRKPAYDLKKGSFKDGWEIYLPKITSVEYSDGFKCGGCPIRFTCAQCPALAETEFQNEEERIDYICELSKLRIKEFVQKNDV